MLILFILSYTLGAVVTYGAIFSFWQSRWYGIADKQHKSDMMQAVVSGVFWPICIFSALSVWGRKPFQSGLKFY